MKAQILFFLVLALISSNASASWLPAPFNILDDKVFDEEWSVADRVGNPVKDVKSSQHIRGWIDIVGFREMCIINGTMYVNGSPMDFAIVKRRAWHTPVNGKVVSFTSTYHLADCGYMTTATQSILFHWKYKKCSVFGCHWVHVYEHQKIKYSTISPETFNNSIDDYEITITSYNNSVTPYTLIWIPNRWNIVKHSVNYKNDTASWYNLTGLVGKNDRGTEHVEFFNTTGYTIDVNNTIAIRGGFFVINEAPLNWSLLDISVFTPYIERGDIVCNATIYNSKPSDFILWKPIVTVVGIMASFLIGIFVVLKR